MAGSTVPFSNALKLLGVMLDSWRLTSIKLRLHFPHPCVTTHSSAVDLRAAKAIAVSIVGSRLDYCNSLLYGTTQQNFDTFQCVQNTLARIVFRAKWSASAPDLLHKLHWLPIRQHVRFSHIRTDGRMGERTFEIHFGGIDLKI